MRQCFVPTSGSRHASSFASEQPGEERQTGQSVPLFFRVKACREDLPLMEELRACPNIQVDLLPTAGEHPQVTAADGRCWRHNAFGQTLGSFSFYTVRRHDLLQARFDEPSPIRFCTRGGSPRS
jgi:hypothetical protein